MTVTALKMLLVFTALAALFLTPAVSQQMVTVGFYGESLCPDCIAFIGGPLTTAFKEVCWCALIRIDCAVTCHGCPIANPPLILLDICPIIHTLITIITPLPSWCGIDLSIQKL